MTGPEQQQAAFVRARSRHTPNEAFSNGGLEVPNGGPEVLNGGPEVPNGGLEVQNGGLEVSFKCI